MPLPDCEVACRLLHAIVRGAWPWSDAIGLVLTEAETSGVIAAGSALAWLEAGGWVDRWALPAVPSDDDGKGGRAEALVVVLSPWGLSQMAETALGERYELVVVENATGEREWYDYVGNQPRHYLLPKGERMLNLSDPRVAAEVASLTSVEAGDVELMADHRGDPVTILGGYVVPVTASWGKAAKAAKRKDKVA